MTDAWAALMVVTAGLFAGGAATFSWSRVPVWRTMPPATFREDFSKTIDRTDKVQPALLIAAITGSVGYAASRDGSASVLAWLGAAGFIVTFIASVAVLVPLQRRIIARIGDVTAGEMRSRWYRGQLGRSVVSTLSFVAVSLAVAI
jgi:hypothetical protein